MRFSEMEKVFKPKYLAIWGMMIVLTVACWLGNTTKFVACDFESPLNCEIVHGVGLIMPPASIITIFYDTDKEGWL